MLRKNGGFMFLNVSLISLCLGAVGVWYLYRAYTSGELTSDLEAMAGDGKRAISMAQTPAPGEGATMPAKAIDILKRYITATGNNISTPQTVISSTPEQGGYYAE